jgi:alpha-beta hydrolase superfamily lysophospholipase
VPALAVCMRRLRHHAKYSMFSFSLGASIAPEGWSAVSRRPRIVPAASAAAFCSGGIRLHFAARMRLQARLAALPQSSGCCSETLHHPRC